MNSWADLLEGGGFHEVGLGEREYKLYQTVSSLGWSISTTVYACATYQSAEFVKLCMDNNVLWSTNGGRVPAVIGTRAGYTRRKCCVHDVLWTKCGVRGVSGCEGGRVLRGCGDGAVIREGDIFLCNTTAERGRTPIPPHGSIAYNSYCVINSVYLCYLLHNW